MPLGGLDTTGECGVCLLGHGIKAACFAASVCIMPCVMS